MPTATAMWSFIQILFICELGQRLTNQFEQINDEICRFDWYSFPIDIQKALLILINGAQIPIEINGVGNILCTREAFKNVSQSEMK